MYICNGYETKERGHWLSPHLLNMAETTEKILSFLEPILEGTDIFVVNVRVKPINNIKVYLDAESGFSIEKCSMVNRKLYAQIEAAEMFPAGDFSLEVSSPGVDEPLLQYRQYVKNIGRKVTVTDSEDVEKTGILKEVTEENITLEIKPAKQKESLIITQIPFSNIKKTVVQIIFN